MSDRSMPVSAAPDEADKAISAMSGKQKSRQEAISGAIRTLQVLLVGTIILPLLLGAVGGYLSYRTSYQRAASALAEAGAGPVEKTAKILDTHVLVAARIDDLLVGKTDAELRAQEATLHERIAQQIADLPQVAAAWIVDADGHELASARVFPVNRDLDNSSREDFRALRDSGIQTFIRALRARSLGGGDFQPYFTLTQPRRAPHRRFPGILLVALAGPHFPLFF